MSHSAPSSGRFPERIGRYELLFPIGSGGMATVYLARSEGAGGFARTVALKLLHAHLCEEPDLAASIIEEAKLAGKIHHPNVVNVIDAGEDPAGPYLVMDYVEGQSLDALLRKTKIPAPIALRVLDDALAGLHAAHELKSDTGAALDLIHRDFTPHNILVGVDGLARLLDFGVAKALGRDGRTRTGVIKGKVRYMAPEQVRGQRLDRRCDVWAAGVVAWELLSGRRIHSAEDDEIAVAMRVLSNEPPHLREVCPELPGELADAVASALERREADRCPSAAELRRLLARGAEKIGGLASPADVGDFVFKLASAALEERARRAAAVREARRDDAPSPEAASEPTLHASSVDTKSAMRRSRIRVYRWSAALTVAAGAAVLIPALATRRPAAPIAPAAPSTPPSAPEAPPPAAPSTDAVAMLTVSANLPIQGLRLGERDLAFDHPAKEVVVQLRADEHAAPLEIRALSSDGLRAATSVIAGATTASIAFPVTQRHARPPATSPRLIRNPYK